MKGAGGGPAPWHHLAVTRAHNLGFACRWRRPKLQAATPAPAPCGEVAEWLKAPHSKCGILARVSGVRIPPSPPTAFPEQLAAWLDSVANDPVAYRQISLNGSELMAVYFTVLVIEAWPRKCCKRRVSMPFAARA